MTLKNSFLTALRGLRAQKSRSALTVLGIVIGITAIMIVMSLGSGAQSLILAQVQGLGSKTIAVIPGREPHGPSDFAQVFSDSLKERDLLALQRKENVPTLSRIMPIVFGGETGEYQGETYRLSIFGATPLISEIFDLSVAEGNLFSDDEVKNASSVVVIGSKVKEELFGDEDAVGERIKMKNRSFRVIGVLPKKGQLSFFDFDQAAIIPYTTAQRYIFGIKYFHRFIAEAQSEEDIERTASDIKLTLRNQHGITDPAKDDFFVQTQADLAKSISTITNVLTMFLAAVAAISLLVGGVGIMNIMLVAVTERTREIGLRKAIGATDSDILRQFLLEAVILTGTGGFIGVVGGTVLSFLSALVLSKIAGLAWSFSFPFQAAVLGIVVSAIVGLVFGLYPARKAAQKSPIDALRYE